MTAVKYGELAASILKIAAEQSEECAKLALERPLQCCAQWTPLDLIVRAKCDKVGCCGNRDIKNNGAKGGVADEGSDGSGM